MWHQIKQWFSPSARRSIFGYHNGQRRCWADPLVVLRTLDKHAEWQTLVRQITTAGQVDHSQLSPELLAQVRSTPDMMGELATVIREAFHVSELISASTPLGLTDVECVTLLAKFLAWCSGVGEEFRPFLKSLARPAPTPEPATVDWSEPTSTGTKWPVVALSASPMGS